MPVLRFLGRLFRPATVWMWRTYERAWERHFHMIEAFPGSSLRLQFETYRGEPFVLSDGTRIGPGTRIAEIHLDNERLGSLHTSGRDPAVAFLRAVTSGLDGVARVVDQPQYRDVMAVWGMSLFAQAAPHMGFELRPVTPAWRRWVFTVYMRWIIAHYHPQGWERFRTRRYVVQEVWMPRGHLQRFAKDSPAGAAGQT